MVAISKTHVIQDDEPAIYAFRGGNVNHIESLATDPAWEVHRLRENYRSDKAICEAANRLMPTAKITSMSDKDGIVCVRDYPNPAKEQAAVADEALLCFVTGESVAVLLRYNQHVNEWTAYLESRGIPVARRQSPDRPADWALAKAAVALLADPQNEWLAYQLTVAMRGEDYARNLKLELAARGADYSNLGYEIPRDLPIFSYTTELAHYGVSGDSLELISNAVSELYLAGPSPTGQDLLLALAEESEQTTGPGIVVTTYHGAKGREWDTVYLPNFEDHLIPGPKNGEDLAEARRLAFVAITRARHYLCLSHSQTRAPLWGGRPEQVKPSRFIQEMGL